MLVGKFTTVTEQKGKFAGNAILFSKLFDTGFDDGSERNSGDLTPGNDFVCCQM